MNSVTLKNINQELEYIDPDERRLIDTNIEEPLTIDDLINILGYQFRDDMILYSDLDKYQSIGQLLPRNNTFKIILIRDTPYSGHFVVILRYKKIIEWFDSYGFKPGDELDYMMVNNKLDQTKSELINLLRDAQKKGFQIVYNNKDYQQYSTDYKTIAVCGRYCSLRIIMLLKYNYDLEQFNNFMDDLRRRYKLNYDELVSLIIK
jgi:hypothetical protein